MMNQNEVVLQEGLIYMIECKDSAIREFYVGSTLKTYSYRRNCHKSASKVIKTKLYNFINNNGQWNNWNVNVIEYVYVKNKKELRLHEQSWIETLLPTLNDRKAYISHNKSNINEKARQVVQCSNCDKTYTKCVKSRHQKSKYCKNYNTTSESSTESFIESDTDIE